VDIRSDVFSAGIVLWETLSGRRLFCGETNLETVQLVRAAKIPPLAPINPDIDSQLEALVGRALAKEPSVRFQTAEEFGHALTAYLFANQLMVTSYDIGILVKRTLSARDNTRPMLAVNPEFMADAEELQGEVGGFVSLEELERSPFVSVSSSFKHLDVDVDEDAGEHLQGSVDPRSWAGEFELPPDDSISERARTPAQADAQAIISPPPVPPAVDSKAPEADASVAYPSIREDYPIGSGSGLTTEHPSMIEPVVQRIEEKFDEAGSSIRTRVSLMEFSAPPAPIAPPTEVDESDSSLILGIVGGLVGAGLIIGLTLYLV
jgi:serine/threonine protein kinase